MSITLNLMLEDDLDRVTEISNLSLKESWSIDSFLNELSNPLAKYIIAKENGKPIGFAGVWTIVDEGHITNIAVHPDYRGRGIGSMLLEELIEKCYSLGCNSLTLEVRASNIAAQNLYKKYLFIEEGIRKNYYKDNKEDAIIMWRRQ